MDPIEDPRTGCSILMSKEIIKKLLDKAETLDLHKIMIISELNGVPIHLSSETIAHDVYLLERIKALLLFPYVDKWKINEFRSKNEAELN